MPRWIATASVVVVVAVVLVSLFGIGDGARMIAGETSSEYRALEKRLNALEQENRRLREQVDGLAGVREELAVVRSSTERLSRLPHEPAVHAYSVPDAVSFCGERLELAEPEIRRRFQEEFERFLVNRHWVLKWMRRSHEVFPVIERRLAAAGLPDDLKYVMVIESGVDARAVSSAGAVGWWQFMEATGKRHGLRQDRVVDERRDLGRSTDAAIAYFRELHSRFGSWPLALSAYNAGENRIATSIEEQGSKDFLTLVLPLETEAYWFKAAAAKLLMESPGRYGFVTDVHEPRVVCDTLEVRVTSGRVELRDLLAASELDYRQLKLLNPALRRSYLTPGSYELAVPANQAPSLAKGVEGLRVVAHRTAKETPGAIPPGSATPTARTGQRP